MESNQQTEEEEEVCSICLDDLRKYGSNTIFRATCCGKGMHKKCDEGVKASSMSFEQKNQCVMCRTEYPGSQKEGVDQLRPWVEKGKAWAQSMLGQMYRTGKGVDQSYERAAEYYEAAARQGHDNAQYNLGLLYVRGQGVEQSSETARAWMIKAAEQGHENAIKGLQMLDKHEGRTTPSFTPPKRCSTCDAPKTSIHKLRNCKCKGAQYCDAECQTSNWKSHKKEHHRLCKEMELTNTEGEMKDEVVEEEVGETKETAPVVSQQQQEEEDVCPVCIEALQKDPKKFIRNVCCGKGIHIWCNEGIHASSLSEKQKNSCPLCRATYPRSNEEMVEQIRPWVEKGKAWAQYMLGQRYKEGSGVDQSYQQARELYELAASQGFVNAQYNLGIMYNNGQGMDHSYERAKEYYEAAARQGHANAQNNLGVLYANGQGVEQSNERAKEWWMKSAEQGNKNAIKALQQLDKAEGRTTPSFTPKPFECATCYRPHDLLEHKLRPCNGCHRVYYCGKECQTKHWKREINGHKKMCNKKAK